jgi:hypothetical protein
MVDLKSNEPAFAVNGIGQGPESREHLVTVGAEHLGMGFAQGIHVGMPADD